MNKRSILHGTKLEMNMLVFWESFSFIKKNPHFLSLYIIVNFHTEINIAKQKFYKIRYEMVYNQQNMSNMKKYVNRKYTYFLNFHGNVGVIVTTEKLTLHLSDRQAISEMHTV